MKNQKNIEQLQQTIKFYETLLQVSNHGILITDASRNIIEVNDAFCSFIGQNRKDVIESNLFKWLEIFSKDAAENWIKLEKAVHSKQVVSNCEFQLSLNNEIRYFDVNDSFLEKIENEKQGFIVSNWHDVTERKKAEEALKKKEEQFRLITENTSDVVTLQTFDLKAFYTYVSPSIKAMSGYEPEEMLGRSVFEFIHPDDREKLFPLLKKYVNLKIKRLLTGKELLLNDTIEFRVKDKSGNWRYAQSTGNIVGNQLLFVSRDITERKQAEKALRESESQKRAILDGITTNIAFVNKNLEILWVNKASAISVGKSPGEMIGHKCYELWADPQRPCEGCPTVKAWKTRKSEHAIMNTPDGRVWEERSEPIFDQYGKLIGMVEIARDITERKRAEEELDKYREHLEELVKDRTQKLEEQNKELGRLNNLFVNREFRIKELRDKVKELEEKISDI